MNVGDRLREIREAKKFSQGDIEKRTGLLRCYISRVENGHTVPSLETLEKMARAVDLKLYQLFYDGNNEPPAVAVPVNGARKSDWASSGAGQRLFAKIGKALSTASQRDRDLILHLVQKMGK